jgi:hypothetical protein
MIHTMRAPATLVLLSLGLASLAPAQNEGNQTPPPINPPPARVNNVGPDTTMLVVNGNRIVGREYIKRLQVMPNVGRMVNGQFVELAPGFLMLQQMIDELLMIQIAKEKNVYPNDADVDAEVKRKLAVAPGIMEGMLALGLTAEDLRHEAIIDLCEFRVLTMGVTISNQEVEQYYQVHKQDSYTIPKRYVLRVVAVATDEAQRQVDGELAAGTPFAQVAARFSIDASKIAGGFLGPVPEANLGAEAKPVIMNTAKGGTTNWIRSGTTRLRFHVEDILPSEVIAFEDVREQIRRKLLTERGMLRNNIPRMLREARRNARVDYQGTPFDLMLKQLFEQE